MSRNKKVVVVGTGYVGLPLAIMLARSGYRVVGVDIRENVVSAINAGILPIVEKDIEEIFNEPQVRTNLRAQNVPSEADIFIISVPTPLNEKRKVADLTQLTAGIESILPFVRNGNLIIIESTVPPLTCREIALPLLEKSGLKVNRDIFLCHCPERILPGDTFHEIVHNDRVIGGLNAKASEMAMEIYGSFVKGELCVTDDVTAELVKLLENVYRDVNIALANEFAAISEGLGIDVVKAIQLANKHPRVKILTPSIGTGGHCIPVDGWFIRQVDPVNSQLIQTARFINDEIPLKIAAKIRQTLREIKFPKIVALGVTYKPDTDDTRSSPAIRIVNLLKDDGYQVEAFDPLAKGYTYSTIEELAKGADCIAVLVEHQVIKQDLIENEAKIKQGMRNPIVMRFFPE